MEVEWNFVHAKKRRRLEESSDEGPREEEHAKNSKKSNKNPMASESDSNSRVTMNGNHIYFFAGVSKSSVYRMHAHMLKIEKTFFELQRDNPTVKMTPPIIYLHINSFGGGVFAAFAAIDFIQQSKLEVHTIIEGAAASAATLMSVVAKKRYIRPGASMLIHQLSSWFGGKMTAIDDEYKNLSQMMDTIKDVYRKYTRIPAAELDDILKKDLWWKSDKCLQCGLVDELWTGEPE